MQSVGAEARAGLCVLGCVRAVRAEDQVAFRPLDPTAHFEHHVDRLVLIGVQPGVSGIGAGNGGLGAAVEALEGEGMRPGMVSCSFL